MEPLSAAASVCGVVSLLIQVGDAISKIQRFMVAIEDAPADIQALIEEVDFLRMILKGMKDDEQRFTMAASLIGSTSDTRILNDLLQTCAKRASTLAAILTEFNQGVRAQKVLARKWNTIKVVLRGNDIVKKLTESLTRLKMMLILGQQWSMRTSIMQMMEVQRSTLLTSERIETLIQEQNGNNLTLTRTETTMVDTRASVDANSAIIPKSDRTLRAQIQKKSSQQDSLWFRASTPFLQARLRYTQTWMETEDDNGNSGYNEGTNCVGKEVHVVYQPHTWLQLLGVRYGFDFAISFSQRGWQCRFQSFNSVPAEAAIFRLSRAGDLDGVKTLLSNKQASVWDVDIRGNTPLHYATSNCHIELTEMLIQAGANTDARNADCFYIHNKTPLTIMCEWGEVPHSKIELLRLLSSTRTGRLDFWEEDSDGWDVMVCLLFAASKKRHRCPSAEPFRWLLRCYQEEIKASPVRNIAVRRVLRSSDNPSLIRMLLNLETEIVTESFSLSNGHINILHETLMEISFDPDDLYETLRLFVDLGVDLHLPTNPWETGEIHRETPTSLAMRFSFLFDIWRKVISEHLGLDFKTFVRDEFSANSVLQDQGWSQKTLLQLFQLEYEKRYLGLNDSACLCDNYVRGCYHALQPQEPWWEWTKVRIRYPESLRSVPTELEFDRDKQAWGGRYQHLDPIPRRPSYLRHNLDKHRFEQDKEHCDCEREPELQGTGEIEDGSQVVNEREQDALVRQNASDKKAMQRWRDAERGICLAWPTYCATCDIEEKRKLEELQRRKRDEGYESDDDDGYGDSMFVLNLDKAL